MRPDAQPIRLIDQQIDALPPLQHPLDVLRHDALDVIDVRLHVADRVPLAALRRPETHHQLLERGVEVGGAVRRQRGEVRPRPRPRLRGVPAAVPREELLLDLDEVAEGDAPAEAGGRDDEVGEPPRAGVAGRVVRRRVGDVVDEVLVVRVG